MRSSTILTSQCRSGAHSRCMHLDASAGGIPKRLRDGIRIMLCGCDCHAACPLTGYDQVSDREWEASCSCPGAELARNIYRRRNEDTERLRAAIDVVQARAEGKTRPEIRQMLIAELRRGSRTLPAAGSIDAAVDRIARQSEHTAAGRTGAARAFAMFADDLKTLAGFFREGIKNDVSDPSGRAAYFISPDSPINDLEVILDATAEKILDALDEGRRRWEAMGGVEHQAQGQGMPETQMIPVWLEAAKGAVGARERPAVVVHLGNQRLGELSSDDSALLDHDLRAAKQQNRTVWMRGRYSHPTAATRARLRLYPGALPFP
jgi:hypothetical protein